MSKKKNYRSVGLLLLLVSLAAGVSGCDTTATAPPLTPDTLPAGQPAADQQLFDSPNQAAEALLAAVKAGDHDTLQHLFGPAAPGLLTGDKVEDANNFKLFSDRALEKLHLENPNPATAFIYIGKEDWPFPIPLIRTSDGHWFFDTVAGKIEILARHIGADELDTIDFCHQYVEAQREYAAKDRDGTSVLKYAQRFLSHEGAKDGLYWTAAPDAEQSPFGPLVAAASLEGYDKKTLHPTREPFHGYFFHILTRQGSAAPNGAYNYIINGNMIAGFALVAAPEKYGASGIMTFIVSHQGKVYQKDLGPKTLDIVRNMKEYNPDPTWTLVKK